MFRILYVLFFVSIQLPVNAQTQKFYTIQPGENLLDVILLNEAYEYPQFEQGIVFFKNGVNSAAKLNYHFIFEEIVFIDANGDTLTLANPAEVKQVYIGKDQFYFAGNRFVKLDTTIGDVKLAVAGFFTTVNTKKIGAFGTSTEGAGVSQGGFIAPDGRKMNLTPNVITTIAYKKALFIGNRFNQFIPVNRKNIFSIYPEKEAKLKRYLDENKINFFSRTDVIDLILYMNRL
jgi:hypothetical protein